MQDNTLLDAVERYLRGEMTPEEKSSFEHLRNTNSDVERLVVEHSAFVEQFVRHGETTRIKTRLNEVHDQLVREGKIEELRPTAIVVALWKKYKRIVFVAASIAGVTALGISVLISLLSPKVSEQKLELLDRRLGAQDYKLNKLTTQINNERAANPETFGTGGTGFLIDGKGYLVTNAHVVKNATRVVVQNTLGEYNARIVRLDPQADLALLKIEDTAYHPFIGLPYGISKTDADLGEDLFTLGYPRPDIVYNKGYLSAETGFQGDTLNFQITIAANPGNSGTPVLNNDGEVVGIVSSTQQNAQGMVFAVRSKNIFRALDAMKEDSVLLRSDSSLSHLKIPLSSALKGLDRRTQIKRIEDYIYIVKRN
jgi:serine protease Do